MPTLDAPPPALRERELGPGERAGQALGERCEMQSGEARGAFAGGAEEPPRAGEGEPTEHGRQRRERTRAESPPMRPVHECPTKPS